jgi:predicted O-methyltransferase YrrM
LRAGADDQRVVVLGGDAGELLTGHAPFDLFFAVSGGRDAEAFAAQVAMLRPGGRIVMDELPDLANSLLVGMAQ